MTICSQAGYDVLAAKDGEEALALSESHPGLIHLLITDVVMPGISGRTVADEIVKRRAETKVLYCSGYAENAIVHHGVLETGVAFLQKPFTATTLLQTVRNLFHSSFSRWHRPAERSQKSGSASRAGQAFGSPLPADPTRPNALSMQKGNGPDCPRRNT